MIKSKRQKPKEILLMRLKTASGSQSIKAVLSLVALFVLTATIGCATLVPLEPTEYCRKVKDVCYCREIKVKRDFNSAKLLQRDVGLSPMAKCEEDSVVIRVPVSSWAKLRAWIDTVVDAYNDRYFLFTD